MSRDVRGPCIQHFRSVSVCQLRDALRINPQILPQVLERLSSEIMREGMQPKEIIVNDQMQRGYRYLLTRPAGRCFHPDFSPDLTPKQMLELGVFGGKYMTDCREEFPASWFTRAKLSPGHADSALNYFKVAASQPLSYWVQKGWINPQDPRGWFQWYCRYYLGRRSDDDERQIRRWKAMQRHIAQLKRHCRKKDLMCRPGQRQALLHWAYDSRQM